MTFSSVFPIAIHSSKPSISETPDKQDLSTSEQSEGNNSRVSDRGQSWNDALKMLTQNPFFTLGGLGMLGLLGKKHGRPGAAQQVDNQIKRAAQRALEENPGLFRSVRAAFEVMLGKMTSAAALKQFEDSPMMHTSVTGGPVLGACAPKSWLNRELNVEGRLISFKYNEWIKNKNSVLSLGEGAQTDIYSLLCASGYPSRGPKDFLEAPLLAIDSAYPLRHDLVKGFIFNSSCENFVFKEGVKGREWMLNMVRRYPQHYQHSSIQDLNLISPQTGEKMLFDIIFANHSLGYLMASSWAIEGIQGVERLLKPSLLHLKPDGIFVIWPLRDSYWALRSLKLIDLPPEQQYFEALGKLFKKLSEEGFIGSHAIQPFEGDKDNLEVILLGPRR